MARRPEVYAAVPTPFDENGAVDLVAAKQRFAALAESTDGVFVAGTVGEFPALDDHERMDLAVMALSVCAHDSVVVHTGAPSARQAVELTERAVRRGARRFAAVTPYYFAPTLSRVLDYYRAIRAAAGDGEVYAYLDPDRTGADIGPDDLAWLVSRAGLRGAVLSGGAAARFDAYVAALPAQARLYSGDDRALPAVAAAGGAGLVSGVAAVFPGTYRRLADVLATADADALVELGGRVRDLATVAGASVATLKMAQSLRGWSSADTRVPIAPVDAGTISALGALVGEFD